MTKIQKMLFSSTLETKNSKTPKLLHIFLLPQPNRQACVDFWCTHLIDGLFWSLPIYLLGFFSKYDCWVIDFIMPLYHFIFSGCHLRFYITRFHMTNFLNEICLINIQIINFNYFKSYWNEILKKIIWKIMQELIKIKHVNLKIK
jgi:hypothetical protein